MTRSLMISTCLAGAVGALVLAIAPAGAADDLRGGKYRDGRLYHHGYGYRSPRYGYGYGGYARGRSYGYGYGPGVVGGGYGYGYTGAAGVPYYYGGPYPYGYYQYPTGYAPTYGDPYAGYGVGNFGLGLGY